MKSTLLITACALLLALAHSCDTETKTSGAAVEVVMDTLHFEKMYGAGCDQPDTLRTNCVEVDLSWLHVAQGPDSLKKAVEVWANAYLAGILAPGVDSAGAASKSVEAAAQELFKSQEEFAKEAPDSPMGLWVAEASGSVLLNDGKHLTLQIEGFTYMGGAHGNPTAAVATFEAGTGRQITWDDLATDQAALKALAEKKFREERADAFEEGFEFDEIFSFALPANFGLADKGIYFYYLPYEVGPYAMGGTQFTLTFEELGDLSKIGK